MRMSQKSKIFFVGGILCVSLFFVLLFFSRQSYDSHKGISWFYENIEQPTNIHKLKILSINPHDGRIKMEYSTDFPAGRDILFLHVDFGYEEWDLGHSESGFVWGGKILSLIEQKKKIQDIYLDKHENNTYKAEFEIFLPINQKRFPFDAVTLDFWIYRDFPGYLSDKVDTAKFVKAPWLLEVYSYLDGYVLTIGAKRIIKYYKTEFPDAEVVEFSLKRDVFIRIMTIMFFVLGLVISLYIAFTWHLKKLVDLSVLTYFAALWGIRSILLDPIPEPKPFPTLIDTFVLYMMLITPILFGLIRKLSLQDLFDRLRQEPEDTGR